MVLTAPAEGEWLSSTGLGVDEAGSPPDSPMDNQPPQHPVGTMQGAFEESMMETMTELEEPELDNRYSKADSVSRRKMLLEQENYERTVAGRWKQKPGEKFHPLWKLVAQISFGMHLLQQGLAKSDDEVLKILQTHVDEVDGFLERTTEDFDLAQDDIDERIRYLQLPLQHGDVFDTMLDDRSFRTAIVEGNEKIEHIVDRTVAAMKDALKDVQKGLDATKELGRYLMRIEKAWDNRTEEHVSVYLAMIGNCEGWTRAFGGLQQKGHVLSVALIQLGGIIAEIQRRAGIASRKNVVALQFTERSTSVEPRSNVTSPRYSLSPPGSPIKPLPRAPAVVSGKRHASSPEKSTDHESRNLTARKSSLPSDQQSSKDRAPARIQRKPSHDTAREESPMNGKSMHARKLSDDHKPVADSLNATKIPSRRVSFSERTRSITRKIPFVKDSSNQRTDRPMGTQNNGSGPIINARARSPTSDDTASGSSQSERSAARNGSVAEPRTFHKPIDPHLLDGGRSVIAADISTPGPSGNTTPGSIKRFNSIMARPKVVTIREPSSESINLLNPRLQKVQAREVHFSNTAPGSPVKAVMRDLPLRHYRSQESLPSATVQHNAPSKLSSSLNRASSVREPSTTNLTPATGSSVYSREGQSSSAYPSAGQRSDFLSPDSARNPPTIDQPASAPLTGDRTQNSSIYSPDAPSSAAYSISLSAYTGNLSPVPAQSSATPSPLRIGNKHSQNDFSAVPEKLLKSIPYPIPEAGRESASESDQESTSVIVPNSAPTRTVANTPGDREPIVKVSSSGSSDPAYLPPKAAVPITAFSSTIAPANSLPRPDSPIEILTSATVSGPEPENPYDYPSSETSFSAIIEQHRPVPAPTAITLSKPTFSPFPSPRPTTPSSRAQVLYNGVPSPALPAPRTMMTLNTRGFTHEEAVVVEKEARSPWKKVFGHGIGKGIGSLSKGHKKSGSDVVSGSGDGLPVNTKKGRSGDEGVMGMGKDGVWISRKNFLRA